MKKYLVQLVLFLLIGALTLVLMYLLIGAKQTINDQQKRINLLETVISTTLKVDSIHYQLEIEQIKAVNGDGHDTSK